MSETTGPIQANADGNLAESASPPASRWQVALRALRHRNFQLFFSGQLISLIGTWMQSVAQSWLVYRLTGSALLLGSVGFASQIPVFLFAPLGGITADRFNRRHIVIGTQVASMVLAFILAALTLLHKVQVWHVFVLAALLGVVNAFDIPGRQSFLVDMVGKEDLMNAIALNSSMFNGARVIGPAIAGILVAKIGEGWCFFANAVSYIAVIIGLLMMKVQSRPRASMASPFEHMMEGFRFVNRTAPIRALLLLLGLVSLVGMPYVVLMPIFADKILHGGAQGLGILMGATGVGALLGALTLAFREGVKGLGQMGRIVLRWFWSEFGCVRGIAHLLDFRNPAVASWLHNDVADGLFEHADSSDGAGRAAGASDGGLFDDVHGHGSHWSAVGRCSGRPPGRATYGRDWRGGVSDRRGVVLGAAAQDSRGSAAFDCGAGRRWRRAFGDGHAVG